MYGMYGILWSKSGSDSILTMAGRDYSTLDVYLESGFHPLYNKGYKPEIVSVHKEDGRWVY